jgi:hypothetical protein
MASLPSVETGTVKKSGLKPVRQLELPSGFAVAGGMRLQQPVTSPGRFKKKIWMI